MLRDRTWLEFISGPDDTVLTELYEPALSCAVKYDRSCAYFASSVLAAAARGFGGLIQNLLALGDDAPKPAIRLLVNEHLEPQDLDALLNTSDLKILEEKLLPRLSDPVDALAKARLEMLAYLVAKGLLEVKVGVMRAGQGIMHAKFGLITDAAGESLVFAGSGNESRSGLRLNYENLEVSGSWDRPGRQKHFAEQFESLWEGTHPAVATLRLPDAVKHQLIKLAPEAPPKEPRSSARERQEASMRLRFLLEVPYTQNGQDTVDALAPVSLWPHQRVVARDVVEAWPAGRLLCDEVGMGKTLEAITSLRRLLAGRGVQRALLLVPAGLLRQWQGELREKGGLIVPRIEGTDQLIWPDGRQKKVSLEAALTEPLVLMSRETARLEVNRTTLMASTPWDLVILDESHAARRRSVSQVGEYNSASLLLQLLRELQLRQKARSLLLLSATPMQTQAWEPWDLLSVLGEGGAWLADFENVELLYRAAHHLENGRSLSTASSTFLAHLIASDPSFPPMADLVSDPRVEAAVRVLLDWPPPGRAKDVAAWLRQGSPLGRRMHRNTRETLREYHRLGMIEREPPTRDVQDAIFEFGDSQERTIYDQVTQYIDRRFSELGSEEKRSGKGFVLTVYRRRAASSLRALALSLQRRSDVLRAYLQQQAVNDLQQQLTTDDVPDDDDVPADLGTSLPQTPAQALAELNELSPMLAGLNALGIIDSKLAHMRGVLKKLAAEGRSVLIFTQYADTMKHLRAELSRDYGAAVASYSGEGGSIYASGAWSEASKDEVTRLVRQGAIRFLVCTDAASEGLNLQAAGAIVNYDLPWNPSRVEQRIGRIDRIGQKRTIVKIVNLYLKDSVDDQVYGALRRRCGLFNHFVGAMQPVLALARRMLDGSQPVDLAALDGMADELEGDYAKQAPYINKAELTANLPEPAATLVDLAACIDRLPPEAGVAKAAEGIWGIGDQVFAADPALLEGNPTLRPLSFLDPAIRHLPDGLEIPGERLPLVTETSQSGGFRFCVMLWVDHGGHREILSLADLEGAIKAWDGRQADPQRWIEARAAASSQINMQLTHLQNRAQEVQAEGLAAQVAAASFRLTWQLGKYLICREPSFRQPNPQMHRIMTTVTEGSRDRMRRVHKLIDYPQWPDALADELRRFGKQVGAHEKKNRLSGKQIDAALDDPRWQARRA